VGCAPLAAASRAGGGTLALHGASAITPGALPDLYAPSIIAVKFPIALPKGSAAAAAESAAAASSKDRDGRSSRDDPAASPPTAFIARSWKCMTWAWSCSTRSSCEASASKTRCSYSCNFSSCSVCVSSIFFLAMLLQFSTTVAANRCAGAEVGLNPS